MYEFEILSNTMKVLVSGNVKRFLKEQMFVEWIEPSARAVQDAAFLKYRAANWRADSFIIKSL